MGMLGIVAPAIAGLSRYSDDSAAFYQAATLFIAGRDFDALAVLDRLDTSEAKALARLVRKDTIDVLAQLPYRRGGPQVLIEGIPADCKFRVANHTVGEEDLPSPPDASVFEWYRNSRVPDFYICHMLEWHMPPADIHEAPFPVFAQTADTDIHIQLLRRWLPSFDRLFVTDTTEHAMVAGLVPGRTVASSPSPFGWTELSGDPDPSSRDRPIDVFMSGIMLRPYFPDKARFLIKLLREKDLNVFIIDGAVDRRRYLEVMSHSKTTLCYTRNQQALVTRGIDALGVGCVPVTARDNVLKLSVPEDCGFEYDPDFSDIVPAVRAAIEAFDRTDPVQRAARARAAFAPATVTSRYLRTLTVHAALATTQTRDRVYEPLRDTRRNAQFINWPLPDNEIARRVFEHNVEQFRTRLKNKWSSETANNLAREYIVQCAEILRRGEPKRYGPRLRHALRILDLAIARDPNCLVLWLNYVRAARLLGDHRLKERAKARLADLLARDEAAWTVSVHDDIMPPDYSDHLLDQYSYFAILTRVPVGLEASEARQEKELKRIILASLHWLAGWVFGDESRFADAYRLNPDYGPIAFGFVLSALRKGAPISKDVVRAIRSVLHESHLYAQLAAIVIGNTDRLAPHLSREEIETCRHLWETYPSRILPIEKSNFSLGIGPLLEFGGNTPRPTRLLPRIGTMRVGMLVCEFQPDKPAREADLRAIENGPYSAFTRAAGLVHAGLELHPGSWRIVVGNTPALDFHYLLARAIQLTRGSTVAVIFDAAEFVSRFQARLLAAEALPRPVVMVNMKSGSPHPMIVGVVGSRAALRALKMANRPAGLEGWHDPYDLVRSLHAAGMSCDVWGPTEQLSTGISFPHVADILPKNRRYFAEVLTSQPSPWMRRLPQPHSPRNLIQLFANARRCAPARIGAPLSILKRWLRRTRPEALFDEDWYALQYSDAVRSGLPLFRHYMQHGADEGRDPHPLFDAAYYLEQCADAGIRCTNPLVHFVERGARRGLNPNPFFDTTWYFESNPHLADSGWNPLDHYLRRGESRLRNPGPDFDIRWYLSQQPNAGANGKSPLTHYLTVGAAAGYSPRPDDAGSRASAL